MSHKAINVKKRNGSTEEYNIEKINRVLHWATEGISNVSISDIEINSKITMADGITTDEIHSVIISSAANLITVENPNYQYVASKLLNYQLRKEVWGGKNPSRLSDFIKKGIAEGIYDKELLTNYTEEEINKLGEYIDHDRDYLFSYAGIKQLCDKYLIKNRVTGRLYETPQFAYMLIAMAGFMKYKEHRIKYVKKAYNQFSKFKINLPTPIMAGLRTNLKSYASCCLVDIADTKESLTASATAISLATANRYGIGFNIGRIRAINSSVRNGEVVHTGVIPFLKIYEASVKAWQQNGLRGGGATVGIPWWHYEIEDVVVLKNNGGTEDSRVRKLDYCVGMSKLFYDRFLKNENISLFSPHEVKDLYEAFGQPEFDALYEKYEKDKKIRKKVIPARTLMSLIVKERVETGRIYILNVDHANEHGSWIDPVHINNLCLEITHPLKPIQDLNDPDGEIGVCILSALNMIEIKNDDDLEQACDIMVRLLEEVIDQQHYFNQAAKNFATKRRSIGVGITNLAAWLAKYGFSYSDPKTPNFVDEFMEKFQFNLLKVGVELAKERGPCEKFDRTKYAQGILPIDTYKKTVDKFITRKPTLDWEGLRKDIKEFGLRHSTYSAMMPCESSSVIQSSTNGCEPLRSLVTFKGSKASRLVTVAPGIGKYSDNYELAFDLKDNIGLMNVNAAIQKWIDMAMSTNLYYKYSHYDGGKLPDSQVVKEILYAYSVGLKSLYYSNADDGDKEQSLSVDKKARDCDSGACSI
jgi:ribonucleoside-diphosphate reductase alpha chain